MIVVKITRKCGICGEEINLVLDILDLVYDEKTKRFLHAKCEKERLLSRKRGRMPSDEVDSLVEKMSVDAREAIAKCVTQKRRSTGSRNREKNTSDNPKRLLTDYLLYTYDLSCMPKYIYVKLASVYSGKYEGLKNHALLKICSICGSVSKLTLIACMNTTSKKAIVWIQYNALVMIWRYY